MIIVHDNFLPEYEEWKTIIGYENYYQVSNLGRIKSVDRFVYSALATRNKRKLKGRIIKLRLNKRKQQIVSLSLESKKMDFLVSRIVATAFVPNPLNLPDVDHIKEDKDKTNNRSSNLQWTDKRSNSNKYFKESNLSREFTGVRKTGDRFQCAIRVKGKEHYIGTYDTAEEAHKIYNEISKNEELVTFYRNIRKTKGVSYVKATNKWCSYAYKNNKRKHLGFFANEEEALIARNNYLKEKEDA